MVVRIWIKGKDTFVEYKNHVDHTYVNDRVYTISFFDPEAYHERKKIIYPLCNIEKIEEV